MKFRTWLETQADLDTAMLLKRSADESGSQFLISPNGDTYSLIGFSVQEKGNGIGTRVMRKLISKADELGISLSLKADTERNVEFYSRFGFIFDPEFSKESLRMIRHPKN